MADVKWIKIVTDIFDDEKIRFIETLPEGDAIALMWFKLLCIAGKSNRGGFLMMTERIAYTDDMLASLFRRDIKLVRLAIETFERLEMVEVVDDRLYLTNWEKHQNAEKLAEIREQTRARVQDYRQRQQLCNANSVTPALQQRYCNGDVTRQNKNKNQDKELEPERDKEQGGNEVTVVASAPPRAPKTRKSAERFVPPTVDEVAAYCKERGNSIDPEAFWAFYDSRDWKFSTGKPVGKWKSCVITWEKREKERQQKVVPLRSEPKRAEGRRYD